MLRKPSLATIWRFAQSSARANRTIQQPTIIGSVCGLGTWKHCCDLEFSDVVHSSECSSESESDSELHSGTGPLCRHVTAATTTSTAHRLHIDASFISAESTFYFCSANDGQVLKPKDLLFENISNSRAPSESVGEPAQLKATLASLKPFGNHSQAWPSSRADSSSTFVWLQLTQLSWEHLSGAPGCASTRGPSNLARFTARLTVRGSHWGSLSPIHFAAVGPVEHPQLKTRSL